MDLAAADALAIARLREEFPDLIAAYRFGSTAEGTHGPTSDLDYAFHAPRPQDAGRVFDLALELGGALGPDVDLIDLAAAPAVLRMQVVGKGLRVACFDRPAAEAFADFVFANYARLNEERRGILEDIHARRSVF